MRIIFWNIQAGGGSRTAGIARQIAAWSPTVVALAEFRGTPPSQQLAYSLGEMGFIHQLNTVDFRLPVTNALLLAATCPLERVPSVWEGIAPTRWLLASVAGAIPHTIGVMHIPNFVTGYKAPFYRGILNLLDGWQWGQGLMIGDTNSGMPDIDEESKAFTKLEAGWMKAVAARGWVDCFRHLRGAERAFTWYSPNGRNGFRLDQAFLNAALLSQVRDMRYDWGAERVTTTGNRYLSDHAAIILELQC